MAVSGKTSDFEVPYLLETDLPDMGAGDKAIAERVNAILKAIKGDATLATDGTLTVKDGAITSRKAKPTILGKVSTAEKNYLGTVEEVPGTSLTFSVAVDSILWVSMSLDFVGTWVSTDQAHFRAWMYLDGAKQAPGIVFGNPDPGTGTSHTYEALLHQTFPLKVLAGEHTLMMKASTANAAGSSYKSLITEGVGVGLANATCWNALVFAA